MRASRVCEVLARGRSFELLGIAGYAFQRKELLPSQRAFTLSAASAPSLVFHTLYSTTPNFFLPSHEIARPRLPHKLLILETQELSLRLFSLFLVSDQILPNFPWNCPVLSAARCRMAAAGS